MTVLMANALVVVVLALLGALLISVLAVVWWGIDALFGGGPQRVVSRWWRWVCIESRTAWEKARKARDG